MLHSPPRDYGARSFHRQMGASGETSVSELVFHPLIKDALIGFADIMRSTTETCIGEVNIWLKVPDPIIDEIILAGSHTWALRHGTISILGLSLIHI